MNIISKQEIETVLKFMPVYSQPVSFAQTTLTADQCIDLVKQLSWIEKKQNSSIQVSSSSLNYSIGEIGVAANEIAKVYGDPHFDDPDGGKFDVQGEAGKTYNLLNDSGLVLNGHFEDAGNNSTVIGNTGLTLSGLQGSSQIQFSRDGSATLNGQPIQPGSMEALADGGNAYLSPDGNILVIKTAEGYTLTEKRVGGHIDIDVKSPPRGIVTDGVMAGGLLGQTFDADHLARHSTGNQGEGAIEGNVKNYEVSEGIFGAINPTIQKGTTPQTMQSIQTLFNYSELNPPQILPTTNSLGNNIDWNKIVSEQTTSFMIQQTNRTTSEQQIDEENRKTDKVLALLITALKTGHLEIAMLLFSALETKEAAKTTQLLTEQLLKAQAQRRAVADQMGKLPQGEQGQKQLYPLQNQLQEVGDTIQLLTAFIKDISDQKNRTVEFAHNFVTSENQTTLSIVRGMRG